MFLSLLPERGMPTVLVTPGAERRIKEKIMKNFKKLWLTFAFAAVSLMTYAPVALADNFTSPSGTTYTSTFKASASHVLINGSFIGITCTSSSMEGKVEKHGFGIDPGGKFSSLTFSGCTYPVTVLKPGSFDVDAEGAGSGDFQLFGTEIKAHTSIGECVFTTSATTIGSFTGSTSKNARVDSSPGQIPRTGGSFFCGSVGYLVGEYTVTTPSTLTVDGW
jgi:hypothetical protein